MKNKLLRALLILMVVVMSAFTYTPPTHYLPQNDRYVPVLAYEIPPVSTLTLTASNPAAPSGSQVCMDIAARDFLQILTMQFTMQWEPGQLKFKELKGFNLPGLGSNCFSSKLADKGLLTFSWYDPNLRGVTKPDGHALYQVCFEVTGQSGSQIPIQITNSPTPIEISNAAGSLLNLKLEGGLVKVI